MQDAPLLITRRAFLTPRSWYYPHYIAKATMKKNIADVDRLNTIASRSQHCSARSKEYYYLGVIFVQKGASQSWKKIQFWSSHFSPQLNAIKGKQIENISIVCFSNFLNFLWLFMAKNPFFNFTWNQAALQ